MVHELYNMTKKGVGKKSKSNNSINKVRAFSNVTEINIYTGILYYYLFIQKYKKKNFYPFLRQKDKKLEECQI